MNKEIYRNGNSIDAWVQVELEKERKKGKFRKSTDTWADEHADVLQDIQARRESDR